jgi:hypothetical protein
MHPLELGTVLDQDPVHALDPHLAHPIAPRMRFTTSPYRHLNDPDTADRERSIEAGHELGISLARQALTWLARSPSTMVRSRACWVTHSPVAYAVNHQATPGDESSFMKNRTYIRVSKTVSTIRKRGYCARAMNNRSEHLLEQVKAAIQVFGVAAGASFHDH